MYTDETMCCVQKSFTQHLTSWNWIQTFSQNTNQSITSNINMDLPFENVLYKSVKIVFFLVTLLILSLPFNGIVNTQAQHFDCSSTSCKTETMICDQTNANIDCIVDCSSRSTCQDASIYGGAGSISVNCVGVFACENAIITGAKVNTLIDCVGGGACEHLYVNQGFSFFNQETGAEDDLLILHKSQQNLVINAKGDESLYTAVIRCFSTEYCNITTSGSNPRPYAIYGDVVGGTKLIINATGEYSLADRIFCPTDHIPGPRYSDGAICDIYAEGMYGASIYAMESFHNVNIECDSTQSTAGSSSFLFCSPDLTVRRQLNCPENAVGIVFVDPNCLCAAYQLPSLEPTLAPVLALLPTTSAPSFSPTKYDPEEEAPFELYVSNNGCDRGSCASNTFDSSDPPCSGIVSTNQSSADCNANNTLTIDNTDVVTHSVTAYVYNSTSTSDQARVLCFDVKPSFTCYKPTVIQVAYENTAYAPVPAGDRYLNIGYKNASNLLNKAPCMAAKYGDYCDTFLDCPVRAAALEDTWTANRNPYVFYIINGPGVEPALCYNPRRSMNVKLSVKCGQSCKSFQYGLSCLNGSEFDCSQYDGNGKITMDIGQYTFNDTMRIANKQIRLDGRGFTQTMFTHHIDINGNDLIDCHFRQCYLTISNLSYDARSSTNNAIIRARNGGNLRFENVSFLSNEDTTLSFIFYSESNVSFTDCIFAEQSISWITKDMSIVSFTDCVFKQIKHNG
eukprot:93242_1